MNKQELLEQVTSISKRYEVSAKSTGERFNIFRILGVESREVKTHSAFIAELLNPKGSHEQGDYFLKIFCEQFDLKIFYTKNAIVEVEKYVGRNSETESEGGFIDLIVKTSNGDCFIIENKIYAGDQSNQLMRYHKAYPNAQIFYLTLDGKMPSGSSTKGLEKNVHYRCISYQDDILTWLESSLDSLMGHEILKQTLRQYIFLIRHLTYQTTNHKMSEEIIHEIVRNREKLESYFSLTKPDILNGIYNKLMELYFAQMKELGDIYNFEFNPVSWSYPNDAIEFRFKNSKYGLAFGFTAPNRQGFVYGIFCSDIQISRVHTENLIKLLGRNVGETWSKDWAWVDFFEQDYLNWNQSSTAWLAIENGELKENIRTKIEKLLSAIKSLNIHV